jgi:GNAT superfamily N-acetyltransferase
MKRGPVLARSFRPSPARQAVSLGQNGVVDLPPGKIAAIATYLERKAPVEVPSLPLAGRLEPLGGDGARYRRLYEAVGREWLWFTRAVLTNEALQEVIGHPAVDARVLVCEGEDAGLVELDFRRDGECELVFFGLAPAWCGRGIGLPLLHDAIRRAFQRPISRLWLHTCTLDHPAAIRLYLKAGFTPYRRAVEIADDPRLSGTLPRSSAPAFPVV